MTKKEYIQQLKQKEAESIVLKENDILKVEIERLKAIIKELESKENNDNNEAA